MEAHLFEFAILFGGLGLAAAVSLALRLPVVPLYIVAGLGLGLWLEPDEIVHFLGSLGVVFLLFSMGLDFSPRTLEEEPRRFAIAGAIDWLANFPSGVLLGLLLGFSWLEALLLGGIVYMSSSAVVSKCIVDFKRAARPETETILNVLVFEDLVVAAYLVLLGSLASSGDDGSGGAWLSLLRSAVFIGLLILLARRFSGPLQRLLTTRSEEGFTLLLFAFVLLVASSAIASGLSEAVGAFFAGMVIGATDLKERAARTLQPFQTLFAALFFVAFGMSIDLASMAGAALPALLLVLAGLVTKSVGGYLAARACAHTPAQSVAVGLSLVPKGEFSIVIAAMAPAVVGAHSQVVALTVLYVFALSVAGPVLMREADRLGRLIRLGPTRRAREP